MGYTQTAGQEGLKQTIVLKFDSNNALVWTRHFNLTGEYSTGDECYIDIYYSAIIMMGSFQSTLTVNGKVLRADIDEDISKYIVKFDSATGRIAWINDLDCLEANGAIDSKGNMYITGTNKTDMFIQKRNANGDVILQKDFKGVPNTNSFIFGRDIDINLKDGSLVALATVSGTISLDSDITFKSQNPFIITMRLKENCTCSDSSVCYFCVC